MRPSTRMIPLITAWLLLSLAACQTLAAPPVESLPPADTPTAGSSSTPTSPAATDSAAPAGGQDDVRTYVFSADETRASYAVGEVFFNENNRFNLAVGSTGAVDGQILLNFTHPEQSSLGVIRVDLRSLTSDSRRRDQAIQGRWLESAKFPTATFTPSAVSGLPGVYTAGSEVRFQVSGDLEVHGMAHSTTFDVTAHLDGERLVGKATAQVQMTDFGFDPPNIAGMLKAENDAALTLDFVAVPQGAAAPQP